MFENLFETEIINTSLADLLEINPSLTKITQNYFSEQLKMVVKLSPIILGEILEGFLITLEDADDKAKKNPLNQV